jgi:hypothetical protein
MPEEKKMYKQDDYGRAGKGRGTITPEPGMPPPFER